MGGGGRSNESKELAILSEMGRNNHRLMLHVHLAGILVNGGTRITSYGQISGYFKRGRAVAHPVDIRASVRCWTALSGTAL